MPYRVAGKVVREGAAQIVLAKGDRLFTVREGDTLEDGYRVEAIASDRVTLLYVPLDARESIRVTTVLPKDLPLAGATAGSPVRQEMDPSSGTALANSANALSR
jgi:hypothetical protein